MELEDHRQPEAARSVSSSIWGRGEHMPVRAEQRPFAIADATPSPYKSMVAWATVCVKGRLMTFTMWTGTSMMVMVMGMVMVMSLFHQ